VEKIVASLREKHSQYSVEKLNVWAHMIHMGKHASYEVPPNLPYFVGQKSKAGTSTCESPFPNMSPGKRINLRTECMDQLSKWHGFLEKGAITQKQYNEFQKKILGDLADL